MLICSVRLLRLKRANSPCGARSSSSQALQGVMRCSSTPGAARRAAPRPQLSTLVALPTAANAISGGGKDYAEATIKNQNFDGQKLDNKDFSGADAVDTSFKKASLSGARFFKSDCERADFSGADLTGASFESANLERCGPAGAKAEGTAFSQTILDAKSFDGADFTEAVVQPYVQKERASGRPAPSGLLVRDGTATGALAKRPCLCAASDGVDQPDAHLVMYTNARGGRLVEREIGRADGRPVKYRFQSWGAGLPLRGVFAGDPRHSASVGAVGAITLTCPDGEISRRGEPRSGRRRRHR